MRYSPHTGTVPPLIKIKHKGNTFFNIFIARYIGVSQATVSKELNRNADTRGRYSPKMAQMFADMMKERSRRPYKFNDKMRALIADKLEKYQWSPEQIKGYCQANDIEMVSVE